MYDVCKCKVKNIWRILSKNTHAAFIKQLVGEFVTAKKYKYIKGTSKCSQGSVLTKCRTNITYLVAQFRRLANNNKMLHLNKALQQIYYYYITVYLSCSYTCTNN